MNMKRFRRNFKRFFNKLGFTLTEMICAVALMGIVAGISIPIIGASKKSRTQKEYRNSVNYVLGEARAVCDAINDGSRSLSGTVVASPTGSDDNRINIQNYLDRINALSHKFKILVRTNVNECGHLSGSHYSIMEVVIVNVNAAPPIKDLDKNNTTNVAGKVKVSNPRSVAWIFYYDKDKDDYVYKYDVEREQGTLMNYDG